MDDFTEYDILNSRLTHALEMRRKAEEALFVATIAHREAAAELQNHIAMYVNEHCPGLFRTQPETVKGEPSRDTLRRINGH